MEPILNLIVPFFFCVALLLALHCFFVLAAVSIKRARGNRLRELKRVANGRVRFARVVMLSAEKYLISAQVGIFLTTLLLGLCSFELLYLSTYFFIPHAPASAGALLYWTVILIQLFVLIHFYLVVAQVAKSLGYSYPEKTLILIARGVIISAKVFGPFVAVITTAASILLRPFGLRKPAARESAVTVQEISEMVQISTDAGEIEEEEQKMIEGVFNLSDTLVREVMTPRADIVSVPQAASLDEIAKVFACERLSRILVTGANLDEVKGVLHAKDLIQYIGRPESDFEVNKIMRLPYFVPNNTKIAELLPALQSEAVHLAIVLDEHGGVDGVVTIEDLVEEIVGEIRDEYDTPGEEVLVRRARGGDLVVDGSVLVDELNRKYKLELPIGEYDTIAGYLVNKLGRIPEKGELLQISGQRFRIEEVEENRIISVRIRHGRKSNRFSELGSKTLESLDPSTASSGSSDSTESTRARISGLG